ncbi:hypothetical protein J6590_103016 [Homalodisca vitripennis]|nr:hypothetical protein J6590_103016 [Homalodisca vitripennis]
MKVKCKGATFSCTDCQSTGYCSSGIYGNCRSDDLSYWPRDTVSSLLLYDNP